jgi:hypothetical protein
MGICCDTECDQPGARCDAPGREGTCTLAAPAPALGGRWLLAALVCLIAIAALGLRVRRRGEHSAA